VLAPACRATFGERLRGDPVRRDLDGRRQVVEPLTVHADLQPGRPEPLGLLAHGRQQPDIVQRRRAKVVDEATDVGQRRRDVVPGLAQHLVGSHRVGGGEVAGGVDTQDDRAEDWSEPVVQVPAEPSALLLPGAHQLLAAVLQLGRQMAGPGRRGRLPDDVPEQALVPCRQHGPRAAPRQ
jgi:hypothetical protein